MQNRFIDVSRECAVFFLRVHVELIGQKKGQECRIIAMIELSKGRR
jgi:hypothetical protein